MMTPNKAEEKWKIFDDVKRRLFNSLRKGTRRANQSIRDYKAFDEAFQSIPNRELTEEWRAIQSDYRDSPDVKINQLKGFYYEALFYFACLANQRQFLDAEIVGFRGQDWDEEPPWVEATPLYDIVPSLHYLREDWGWQRKVPQTKADFLMTYVDDSGPLPPALVDVKSYAPRDPLPKDQLEDYHWQILAAMRRGFIFQLAYPRDKNGLPTSLKDWVYKTPCPECGTLNESYRRCSNCESEIIPFTITDSAYQLHTLKKKLCR